MTMSTPKRALVVIDVQYEYVTGALPIQYPPLDVSLPNIASAMDAATAEGIPIVVVRQTAPEDAPIFARGSIGGGLLEQVAERPWDHFIEKSLPSAFTGTDLAEWLAERSVDTISIVGYMTQNCDQSTAVDGLHRGLQVEFLSDATGTLDLENEAGRVTAEELHRSVLVTMQSRFAAVTETADWIDAVRDGSGLVRSNIAASAGVVRRRSAM